MGHFGLVLNKARVSTHDKNAEPLRFTIVKCNSPRFGNGKEMKNAYLSIRGN